MRLYSAMTLKYVTTAMLRCRPIETVATRGLGKVLEAPVLRVVGGEGGPWGEVRAESIEEDTERQVGGQ